MTTLKSLWTRLMHLIRGTDSDLEGTYPEHYQPTGEESATHGSVNAGFLGGGGPVR